MMEVEVIRDRQALAGVRDEWSRLHRDARPGSPFEHPAWVESWIHHWVPDGDLYCVVVRDGRRAGELVGLAPMYRRHFTLAGIGARTLQPIGTGQHDGLTEVVQVLALQQRSREVLRAVVECLEEVPDWNWMQFSLNPDQGWFVPQWLQKWPHYHVIHRKARPCVMFSDLPPCEEEVARRLKRNVRESLRRSRNRASSLGGVTFTSVSRPEEVAGAVESVRRLHYRRTRVSGRLQHTDVLAHSRQQAFLISATRALSEHGLVRVHLAEHRGTPVAGLLVLSDGSTDYLSVSGMEPDYWDLSLNTTLVFQALVEASEWGRSALNLSTGPDVAKLRWSSQLATFNDFAIVRDDIRSRSLYAAYAHASLVMQRRADRQRLHVTPAAPVHTPHPESPCRCTK